MLALNVMEPACSNTVALMTSSCRAVPYCYHTKLLFSMLHSYREMILEWLLVVPGLGYGVWWPWILFCPNNRVPISDSWTRSKGKQRITVGADLARGVCWKESNICTLGRPQWHSFLIHFIAFSIRRCRNCWQQRFDIMNFVPLVTRGWPSHSVELCLSKATGFKVPVTNLSLHPFTSSVETVLPGLEAKPHV